MDKPEILLVKGTKDKPLTIKETQEHFEEIADWFTANPDADPIHFGRWGRPECVVMPYSQYEALQQLLEDALHTVEAVQQAVETPQ